MSVFVDTDQQSDTATQRVNTEWPVAQSNSIQIMHGSECDIQTWWTQGWKWLFQPSVIIFECHTNNCASSVLSYYQPHTHPFNGPLSGTTRVSQYQKGETNLDFTEALPTSSLIYDFQLIFNFCQQLGELSCIWSTSFARWCCNIRHLHSNKLKWKFLFLRYLFACELSFTFCDFDTVAFLIISTVVKHSMLTFIS